MKEKLYSLVPGFLQNAMVSLYNIKAYKLRYGVKYKEFREIFLKNRSLSLSQHKDIQISHYNYFIKNFK